MKMDGEASNEILELSVASEKCRVILMDLCEMLEPEDKKPSHYKDRMRVYVYVILDYLFEIDDRLNGLNENCELIEKSPAPTKVTGEKPNLTA